jgi:hypothetical protein
MALCKYCGQCEEDAPREQHNEYCPMQYPLAGCRVMALADWQLGFSATQEKDVESESPVCKLGFRMNHPDSKLGLE